jgi:hypothetical protein
MIKASVTTEPRRKPAKWAATINYLVVFLGGIAVGVVVTSRGAVSASSMKIVVRKEKAKPEASAKLSKPTWNLGARLGAESSELRVLREAERQMFPHLAAGMSLAPAELAGEKTPSEKLVDSEDHDQKLVTEQLQSLPSFPARDGDPFEGLKLPSFIINKHEHIAKFVRYFTETRSGRDTFATWLFRRGAFRHVVVEQLRKQGLPELMEAVVMVESGYRPTAYSHAGAAGLWQLMPHTARSYDLEVQRRFDQRISPWSSSEAGTRHLSNLSQRLTTWELALAAYNMGYTSLVSRMEQAKTTDFWELTKVANALPTETMLYVPKVLATAIVLNNLRFFKFDHVKSKKEVHASRMEVPVGTRVSLIARAAGTSARAIRLLNLELIGDEIPGKRGQVTVQIPISSYARARVMLPLLVRDSEKDKLDTLVSENFDWGRDDIDTELKSRDKPSGSL